MKGKERSKRSRKPSFPGNPPIGGNEEKAPVGMPVFSMKAFEEATKDRMRKNLLKYTHPKAMKAVEEAERLGEEVSTKNPRIESAFILDEIANHGRPATPVPPELFDAACKAKRSKLSPHFLDPLLYAAITQWGWHARFTYQQMADELWKIEAVRMFFKNKKIKEGLIRSRLNILGVPSKQ